MKYKLLTALSLLGITTFAQQTTKFEEFLQPDVLVNGTTLKNAFSGGLLSPQFNEIDLNLDGQMDLLVFDRDGNVLLPFVATGSGSNTHYKFAPEYRKAFPEVVNFLVTADFNCDGKMDIFTSRLQVAIAVYENTSTTELSFNYALGNDPYLMTDFMNGTDGNVYVSSIDVPAIVDVDGDGDLDILSFETNGVQIYFHENVSPNHCGLDYLVTQDCWGGFREDLNSNAIELDACITGAAPPQDQPEDGMHSGSTILSFDIDNDGLHDMVLGDVSFSTAVLAMNDGTPDSAYMNSQSIQWAPDGSVPIDVFRFPSFYYLDIDFDGKKDFITAPNDIGVKNLNQIWTYHNNSSTAQPNFTFTDSSFLQSSMIDMGEGAHPTFVDLNGDNALDIVVGNRGVWHPGGDYESSLWYFRNTSSGGTISFELVTKNLISTAGLSNPTGYYPAFGDLDGDNDQDLIVGLTDGTLLYYLNTGSILTPQFTLQSASFQSIDVGSNAAPDLFDIDGDGQLDLVIGEKDGYINYYHNSNGTFTLVTNRFGGINADQAGNSPGYSMPRFYDFNGKEQLMVGSKSFGITQFDSASSIVGQPAFTQATFGTGNTSTTGFELTPLGAEKRTGRNQLLFTAQELQSMGFTVGQIEDIAFNVSTNNTSNSITNGIIVRMKNSSMTELTAFETGLTEVYNEQLPVSPGWNTITLQEPFVWDGTSNLVVEICFSKNLPLVNNDVAATDVGFGANAYGDITGYNNNTSNGCAQPYKAVSTLRPNTRMTIRPMTPSAGEVLSGWGYMNADFADLDLDGFPEMLIGVNNGGVLLMKGEKYDISIREPNTLTQASIYPNPTTGRIVVDLENIDGVGYQIIDLNGKVHARGEFSPSGELDLSSWNTGVYILQMVIDGSPTYAKIILQK